MKELDDFVLKLLNYFSLEKQNNGPLLPVTAVHERVCDALQISRSTLARVLKRKENPISVNTHGLVGKGKFQNLSNFTKDAIRRTIYQMHEKKYHVTLKSLQQILEEKDIVKFSLSTLRSVVHRIGFRFRLENNRKYLCELNHVVAKRIDFLTEYSKNLNVYKYEVVFLDETWIFSKGSSKRTWNDESGASVRCRTGSGKRFIILHAGSRRGFVEGASLLFASKSNTGDYIFFLKL